MENKNNVVKVSKKNIWVLRLMIIIGLITMIIFFAWLLKPEHYGGTVLYYFLLAILFFSGMKVSAEWYHYFSIKVPDPPQTQRKFTVDVFTTYCAGEPLEMIEETLRAIKAIAYPHESYLCDESNSPYLKDFCEKLGVHHVTRDNRIDAKAGNINNALKQSNGEICVVLDPDHVPQPDFLDPIIPYFADPEIGFVQVVQAYKNIRESIVSRGAAQQTFQFYGPMMMSMNSYGTVLAIGANCTFRREALDSIGGHAAGLAEDMHTAMQLHAKGWKSVYVPRILARGLVPSSLYAYYKQQLKWSRGVFELLFTTYIRQFKNFSWRQKLHYGSAPLHYFSGVVYFLNFLIPILSLILAVIPLKVDLVQFILIGAPFFANTLLIRHYVQRWVMEEGERGFHLIGGILQIGTWWVHALGFVYAVLRKKVPYIPTPKDGEEGNNLLLNLPNIGIILVSLFAIIYGISIDYNPYTFVMAGLAGSNCLFMGFMLLAGQHRKITSFKKKYQTQKYTRGYIYKLRLLFWNTKHAVYALVRKAALPVSLLLTVFAFVYFNKSDDPGDLPPVTRKGPFYTGIFSPESSNGLTTMPAVKSEEENFKLKFNLVSCYIPWGDKPDMVFPETLLREIIDEGAIPFITWEPWVSTFQSSRDHEELAIEKNGLKHIATGYFDEYVCDFAGKLKDLRSPVFLRFAHEPENPAYPWSGSGGNTPEDFVASWKHVHEIFDSLAVRNVIWVWSPWKAENLSEYFPGEEYVDWIGITGLNYGAYNQNGQWYEFKDYYRPFAADSIFQKNLPVVVAEFGSLTNGGDQREWIKNALRSIKNDFPEIRALIFFNSGLDKNLPEGTTSVDVLNWKVMHPEFVESEIPPQQTRKKTKKRIQRFESLKSVKDISLDTSQVFNDVKGVNYRKGYPWFRNFYALTYREISADFKKIKQLGANTIKWCGPGIYDTNVLRAAHEFSLDVHYSFWIPNEIDFVNDEGALEELEERILETVEKHKASANIKSWNIGNDVWENLDNLFYKPDAFAQQYAFLKWMATLSAKIAAMDTRPITLDLELTEDISYKAEIIKKIVPEIDAFGLIHRDTDYELNEKLIEGLPAFYSDITTELWLGSNFPSRSFISSFQDLGTPSYVSFDGLVNHEGKIKQEYLWVQSKWTNEEMESEAHQYAIMKKANPIVPDAQMRYYALRSEGNQWVSAEDQSDKIRFSWYLVKTDGYGNGAYMEYLGDGPEVRIDPPENYELFELILSVDVGNFVVQTRTKLHTPLEDINERKLGFKNVDNF